MDARTKDQKHALFLVFLRYLFVLTGAIEPYLHNLLDSLDEILERPLKLLLNHPADQEVQVQVHNVLERPFAACLGYHVQLHPLTTRVPLFEPIAEGASIRRAPIRLNLVGFGRSQHPSVPIPAHGNAPPIKLIRDVLPGRATSLVLVALDCGEHSLVLVGVPHAILGFDPG
eukprot:CAMPEP_0115828062 /NCGR_PEP_ID=MMETSP0287-20121206/378_1 /TAXON_ID=412157 /ORGANISM="Chrysochromulina rotalis, Strain UIO044" /LENGTH=171 /DNA_ID=CAMNT_0003281263 /DNA_START=107 /DNA_END=622 /DNA_ORIENTATION=+